MSSPFNFNQLKQPTKVFAVALAIFLVSLSVGMFVFGNNQALLETLSTDSLHHGKDAIHLTP